MKVRPKGCSRKKYVSGKSSAFVDEDGNESKIKSRRVYFVQIGDAGRVNVSSICFRYLARACLQAEMNN